MTSFKTIRPYEPPPDQRPLLLTLCRPIRMESRTQSKSFAVWDDKSPTIFVPFTEIEQIRQALPELYAVWVESPSRMVALR